MSLHIHLRARGETVGNVGDPIVSQQPVDRTAYSDQTITTEARWIGGVEPLDTKLQKFNPATGTWADYAYGSALSLYHPVSRTYTFSGTPGGAITAPSTETVRWWARSAGSSTKVYTNAATLTHLAGTASGGGGGGSFINRFWEMNDFAYPATPAIGSTVGGAQVVRVTNRSQLNAALQSNRYIVLADGNYQDNTRLNIDGLDNVTLHAENRLQARFAFANYRTNNSIHVSRCDDFAMIGLDFARASYYAVRFGADPNFGDVRGPCRRVLVEHCRFRDMSSGCLKIDNGAGAKGSDKTYAAVPAYWSEDFEIRYCEFSKLGQDPPPTNVHFSEGVYMGDGTVPYKQQVHNVNIHHCIFDGSETTLGAGEAIEAKVGCQDVRIADCLFDSWMLSDSTSGGAIALSINTGSNLSTWQGGPPSSGTRGKESYLIERNRIHGTRTISGTIYAKGHALTLGHGNATIRNNLMWGNEDGAIRLIQKNDTGSGVFSNSGELDVDILHNTIVGNGGNGAYSVDFLNPPNNARVRSINNMISGGASYTTNGITWLSQQDAWNVNAQNLLNGSFSGDLDFQGRGHGYGLRPVSDGLMVTGTNANVSTDAVENPRPSGSRQFGALEVSG